MNRAFKWLNILPLMAVLVVTVHSPLANAHPEPGLVTPQQRLQAPDFELSGLDGKKLRLQDYRGQLILLNFWATFCVPCRDEMPQLEALWQGFKDQGFTVIAIATDRGNAKEVKRFVHETALNFPVVLDPDGKVRNNYEIIGLPTTYLIGRDGRFHGRVIGARDWANEKAKTMIRELLAK